MFHVDVNSAFLSWSAAYRMHVLGEQIDLRLLPAVVVACGSSRHSIILAKSLLAGKHGVQTGEPLFLALEKCPELRLVEPDYALYTEASRSLIRLLHRFSPTVEQFSIDEAWVDMSGTHGLYGYPVQAAETMRSCIARELGFTVNIGVSSNKLLAKIAGDFQKPNRVHTLFPEEVQEKLWPLPVRNLFFVGRATEKRLRLLGIVTIGQLAAADPALLQKSLGRQGITLWQYANGRDSEPVCPAAPENKGYGKSITTAYNISDRRAAHQVLLSLCETLGMRLRQDKKYGGCITVQLRSVRFRDTSHQRQLPGTTDVTKELYQAACAIFDEVWDGEPLRQIGVQVTRLSGERYSQFDLFCPELERAERLARLDKAVDTLRSRYGEESVRRACFLRGSAGAMSDGLSAGRRTGADKSF